jgi:hypothetical protein
MSARRLILPDALATRPFTTQAGRAYGLSRSAFQSSAVRRIAPRVYQAAADNDPALRDVVAAHLATMADDVLVDGLTALQLFGIDLGPRDPLRFCSTDKTDIRRAGVRVRRLSRTPPSKNRILTPPAALAAAAVDLDLVDLVVAGDWLVRLKKTTPPALQAYAADLTGRHCRTVRRAADLVRDRVDLRPESRLRMCLVLAGLPDPACNVDLGDDHFFIATPDLAYLLYKVLLEYEGDQHRTSSVQWDRDIDRTRQLTKQGYTIERVTKKRLRRPRLLVEEVYESLVSGGYDGPPPDFSPDWIAHFEPAASSGNSAGPWVS